MKFDVYGNAIPDVYDHLSTARKELEKLQADYAALVEAAREAHTFLTQADFNFKNGNEAQGVDEGEYYGRRALIEVINALAAVLEKD